MHIKTGLIILFFSILAASFTALAAEEATSKPTKPTKTIKIFSLNTDIESQGIGDQMGTIEFVETEQGLLIKTALSGLVAGQHGFHIHELPSCEFGMKGDSLVPGLGAGGHYDPNHTKAHLGPKGLGHLGDLPVLIVDESGEANVQLIAPRLKLAQIMNRSVIIHEFGDNYSDDPEPLGGGGPRIACGVIQ